MGHYRSEMGYEDEDNRRAEEKKKRIAELTLLIQKDIDELGMATVLARFIELHNCSPTYMKWPHR